MGFRATPWEVRMYRVTITTSHGAPIEIDRMDADALNDVLTQWRTGFSTDVKIPTDDERRVFVRRHAIVHIVATLTEVA